MAGAEGRDPAAPPRAHGGGARRARPTRWRPASRRSAAARFLSRLLLGRRGGARPGRALPDPVAGAGTRGLAHDHEVDARSAARHRRRRAGAARHAGDRLVHHGLPRGVRGLGGLPGRADQRGAGAAPALPRADGGSPRRAGGLLEGLYARGMPDRPLPRLGAPAALPVPPVHLRRAGRRDARLRPGAQAAPPAPDRGRRRTASCGPRATSRRRWDRASGASRDPAQAGRRRRRAARRHLLPEAEPAEGVPRPLVVPARRGHPLLLRAPAS